MTTLKGIPFIYCPFCRITVTHGLTGGFVNHWTRKHRDLRGPCPDTQEQLDELARAHLPPQIDTSSSEEQSVDGMLSDGSNSGSVQSDGRQHDSLSQESEESQLPSNQPIARSTKTDVKFAPSDQSVVQEENANNESKWHIDDLDNAMLLAQHLSQTNFDSEDSSEYSSHDSQSSRESRDNKDTGRWGLPPSGGGGGAWQDYLSDDDSDYDPPNALEENQEADEDNAHLMAALEGQEESMAPVGTTRVIPPNDPALLMWALTPQQRHMVRLADMMEHLGCPKYAFDSIMNWAADAEADPYFTFVGNHPSRASFMKQLHEQFKTPKIKTKKVVLEAPLGNPDDSDGEEITSLTLHKEVFGFGLLDLLIDLLGEIGIFSDPSNLNIDPSNPFGPYKRKPGERLDEIATGERYQRALAEVTNWITQFALPLVLYLDKTGIDKQQRYNLEPLLFSLALFKEKIRHLDCAWRVLGYLNDLSQKSSAKANRERAGIQGRGRPLRNYHKILQALLEEIKHLQENPPTVWLRIGNQVKKVELVISVICVIGDMKSGDALAGKYGSHNRNTNRIHRACDCPFDAALDGTRRCKFLKSAYLQSLADLCTDLETGQLRTDTIEAKEARIKLHSLSQHRLQNAFSILGLGNDPHGIAGLQPADMMHAFLKGLLETLLDVIFDKMTDTEKDMLDDLALKLAATMMQTERRFFPKCTFAKGISNRTLLTAEEHAGVAFVLILLSITQKGKDILVPVVRRARGIDEKSEETTSYSDFVELLELTLSFQAWFLYGKMWAHDDMETAQRVHDKISAYLKKIQERIPRDDGHGWFLAKMHEFLHFVRDVIMVGRITNALASHGERLLQPYAKQISVTAQKRGEQIFAKGSIHNMRDKMCIDKVFRVTGMERHHEVEARKRAGIPNDLENPRYCTIPDGLIPGASPYFVADFGSYTHNMSAEDIHQNIVMRYLRNPKKKANQGRGLPTLPSCVEQFILRVFLGKDAEESAMHGFCPGTSSELPFWPTEVYGYTEYVSNGRRYRAEPGYRSLGDWYDWAMIKYEEVQPDGTLVGSNCTKTGHVFPDNLFPARIFAFVSTAKPGKDGTLPPSAQVFAVVNTCNNSNHAADSILTEKWELETRQVNIKTKRNGKITSRGSRPAPRLRLIDVAALDERVLVFEETRDIPEEFYSQNKAPFCHVIHSRTEQWPKRWEEYGRNMNID